jgi:hypothetical protein
LTVILFNPEDGGMFGNRVLRRIFGPSWRTLHNEELHNLYCLPSKVRMIKSRRMRWAGYVACMGEKECI